MVVVLDETKNQNVSIYHRLRNIIKNEKKHFYVFSNEHHKFVLQVFLVAYKIVGRPMSNVEKMNPSMIEMIEVCTLVMFLTCRSNSCSSTLVYSKAFRIKTHFSDNQ